MKIIKPGRPPEKEKPHRFECWQCGCVFETAEDESAFVRGTQYNVAYIQCACPSCGMPASEVKNDGRT
jgi:rubredoxin